MLPGIRKCLGDRCRDHLRPLRPLECRRWGGVRAPALVGSGPGGRGGTHRYSLSPEKAPGGVLGPKSYPKWLGKPEAAEFGASRFFLGPPPAPQRPMREACMCVSRGSSSSASCRQRSPWRCSQLAPAATASTMGTSGDAARGRSAVPQLRCDSLSSWRAAASKHQPPGRGPPNSQRRQQPRYGVPRVVGAPPRRVCARPDALQPAASSSRQQLLRRAALLSACAPTHAGEQLIRACNRTRHPGSLPLADASCT